jgi:hypothetical protein
VEVSVEDGTAHDGAYGIGSVRVACLFDDEDLLSVSIDWIDTNEHAETMLADVEIDRGVRASEADAAIVKGAFDGGGGSANPAKFVAHATCLQSLQARVTWTVVVRHTSSFTRGRGRADPDWQRRGLDGGRRLVGQLGDYAARDGNHRHRGVLDDLCRA